MTGAARDGGVRARAAEGRLGLERGHALGDSCCQGELLSEFDVGAALGCLGRTGNEHVLVKNQLEIDLIC